MTLEVIHARRQIAQEDAICTHFEATDLKTVPVEPWTEVPGKC